MQPDDPNELKVPASQGVTVDEPSHESPPLHVVQVVRVDEETPPPVNASAGHVLHDDMPRASV